MPELQVIETTCDECKKPLVVKPKDNSQKIHAIGAKDNKKYIHEECYKRRWEWQKKPKVVNHKEKPRENKTVEKQTK